MTIKERSLKVIQEDISLKDIFNQEFLDKLKINFEDVDIIPIAVAFALKKDEITQDLINLSYRDDEDIENNTIIIDVQKNPDNLDSIIKTFEN